MTALRRTTLPAITLLLAALWALFTALPAAAEPIFPKLTGRVSDAAGVLPADTAAALEAKLKALEDTTGTQLVVATVPDLQGYEIDEYGYQLGRAWGIGQKGTNNGAILLIAPAQRKLRIEVGYGLEGVLTDAVSIRIIRQAIVPRFKAGDMAGGIVAGADELIALLQLPPDQQAAFAAQAKAASADEGDSPGWGALVWLIIIIVWIIIASRRGSRGRRRGPVIVWGPGIGGNWSGGGSSGWGGGGGGGFGGFSGGGGSFGGGGASGDW
ncbi:TPM domain-containing protein [Sandarakinorhabdus sp. AAP62]|uniref:TPM domain-containing protein n=1 Tax=Sandarakinorhabdus sp. AAP62 TaxID=1248916 RepID=UPI00031F823D|nr:TPM domain-containing protein [Sandarakinorhabdus sp. AAP62]